MDGRSISSRYEFSESSDDEESIHSVHSGQGRTARTVSLARRYVSTVSLFSLRKKDSKLDRGFGARSTASEMFLREKSESLENARPRTSYLFSLGKEHNGQVEIIPESMPYVGEYDDDLVAVIPATPSCESDADNATEGISYQEWRLSALLPLPEKYQSKRPGTGASSIYSRNVDDGASSIYSQESRDTARTRVVGRRLKTRSLLSLAKKYSAPDDEEMFGRYGRGVMAVVPQAEDVLVHDDASSFVSRSERTVPAQQRPSTGLLERRPSTRAGTISSVHSLPTPDRSSWHTKPLPSLPAERGQQTWLLPPSRDGQLSEASFKTWWSQNSAIRSSSLHSARRSESRAGAASFTSCSEEPKTRPSSWSWLSIDGTRSDRASSVRSRKSLDRKSLPGQRFLRTFSLRTSTRSEPAPSEPVRQHPLVPPPSYRRIYKAERDVTTVASVDDAYSVASGPGQRDDLLELPPLQLPELPDEPKVFFYVRCGHFETDVEAFETGPEIPGWCPECSKGRHRRRVVRRPLRSMLKSIAE